MAAVTLDRPAVPRAGELLRAWRVRRRLSQLDLACLADVSTRHLSYVETGRSRPSRTFVLHLAEQIGTTTVLRVVGAALVLVGVDLALLARLSGRRLALAGTVVGELALAWVLGTAAVLALGLSSPVGAALLVGVAAVTAWFGVTELKLAKAIRAGR